MGKTTQKIERIKIFSKTPEEKRKERIGLIVFLSGIVVFILIACSWNFGWFSFQRQPFNVEISMIDSLENPDTFVIWEKVQSDIDLPSAKPSYLKAKIQVIKNDVIIDLETKPIVILPIDSGVKEGRSGGYEYRSNLENAEYLITPIFTYTDSNGQEQNVFGESVSYTW